jgi:predicted DNA-binding protein (UPF0251 family)
MNPKQFALALSATLMKVDGAGTKAARLVLVDGLSRHEAAKQVGIDVMTVSRAVARLQPPKRCEHCGQLIRS